MKRVICWFVGHRWKWLLQDVRHAMIFIPMYTLAGLSGYCTRCGAEHLDGCAEALEKARPMIDAAKREGVNRG